MMFTTAIKIYLVTNLVFLLGISLYWLPDGIALSLFVAPFSLIFSAPLAIVITATLWVLKMSKLPAAFCWIIFLLAIAGMTILPFYWEPYNLMNSGDSTVILVWAYFGAFTSVVIFHKAIHRFFQPAHSSTSNVKREPWSL